ARDETNLETWFKAASESEMDVPRFLDIDYQRYGEGEALLGWLNTTIEIRSEDDFDGNQLLRDLANQLRESLAKEGAEVAHLKMTLTPIGDPFEIAAVNLVRDDQSPELSHQLLEPIEDGELLLNMRVETSPDLLEEAANNALKTILSGVDYQITHSEHFRPTMPVPTHRIADESS
ncbi:MAG: cobalamin biosynthesis protein P47K, partial [Verrucomicrobiota bacterium]